MKLGSYSLYVYITVFYIDVSLICVSANADPSVKWGSTFQLTSGGACALRAALRKVAVSSCRVRMPPIFRICAAVIAVIFHGFSRMGSHDDGKLSFFPGQLFDFFGACELSYLLVGLFVGRIGKSASHGTRFQHTAVPEAPRDPMSGTKPVILESLVQPLPTSNVILLPFVCAQPSAIIIFIATLFSTSL